MYVALTLLMGVSAVNTGNNLLFLVASAMLGFMAVSGFFGWLNIRNLELAVHVPDEVYAGIETLVCVTVANRRRLLSSFLINVRLCGRDTLCTVVERGKEQHASFLHAFPGRGVHTLDRAVIGSAFPVNFFVRRRRTPLERTFPVFPAPRPCPGGGGLDDPDPGAGSDSLAPGYEGDLAKINDYRGGESLKLIHWRLSAKHEVFKVKELTANTDDPVVLEVETLPGRNLEERLSHAAFLINRLQKGGRAVGLKVGERVIPPGSTRTHRLRLLGELAAYGKD